MSIATRTAHANGVELAYRYAGAHSERLPWVFVHGLGEDSRSWRAQQLALADSTRTYALDVRGHGSSELSAADGTLDQLSNDVLGFVKTIGPSVCVGFSMGGAIVLAAAARQREPLIHHAIAVCTSSVVGRKAADRFRARAAGIRTHGRAFAVAALTENLTSQVTARPDDWDDHVAMRVSAIGNGAGYANGALAMASMQQEPLTPRLADVDCPVDVLVAEHDESCPRRAADIIVDAVPHGRVHGLPGVGHFVNIERPSTLTDALATLDSQI